RSIAFADRLEAGARRDAVAHRIQLFDFPLQARIDAFARTMPGRRDDQIDAVDGFRLAAVHVPKHDVAPVYSLDFALQPESDALLPQPKNQRRLDYEVQRLPHGARARDVVDLRAAIGEEFRGSRSTVIPFLVDQHHTLSALD